MANASTISNSNLETARMYAEKYAITISQAIRQFEDIELMEAGKLSREQMYEWFGWESLKPVAPVVEDIAESAADEIELEEPTDATLGDALYESAEAVEETSHDFPPKVSTPKRYEAEVIAEKGFTLVRSKSFGFTIRIDEGEMLIPFLITGDKVTFECNLDWFHNPRAVNVKRLIEIDPEPTGPALTGEQREIIEGEHNPDFDYMSMTPVEKPLQLLDRVLVEGWKMPATITNIGNVIAAIRFDSGVTATARLSVITRYTDPRDTEITRLKAEIAALKAEVTRLESSQMSDVDAARFGLFVIDNYGSLEAFIEQENK